MKIILKTLLVVFLLAIIVVAGFLAYVTFTEYMPNSEEPLNLYSKNIEGSIDEGNSSESDISNTLMSLEHPKLGYAFNILTWNIGYGAMGDNADFVLEGGYSVNPSTEERVNSNMANIISQIKYQHPNIVLLQEVDRGSERSYYLDEAQRIVKNMPEKNYTFAKNHDAPFIPYPIPPIGEVESGILTLSDFEIESATRIQIPISGAWPMRLLDMKRCMAVHRIPIEGSGDRELVIINLHLESYTDGKEMDAQMRALNTVLENEENGGNYVIAGGDFNQVFSSVDISEYPILEGSWEYNTIDEFDFSDSWQFVMDNRVPTCRYLNKPYEGENHDPSQFQYYMLDGFILSSNIKVLNCETKDLGFAYSDHNPVFLRVKLVP